ncbi:MAG TPA: type II toxin-antitoxin system prevent-host-death family antitoxin [bacterium]|nr:type II toxin-antitoxin system prevent-host-death family antitoxin [bacterium]
MAISKFKAECLSVMEEVRVSGKPLLVTRFGKPVAEIVPAKAEKRKNWAGCMAGTFEILGDIVGPTGEEWEVLR